MLRTPIGTVDVLINGKSYNYKIRKLRNRDRTFTVDGRYMIIVGISNDQDIVVECKLTDFTGDDAKGSIESGARLALTSFYRDNIKLSIGVEDEISGVQCSYIDYGIEVALSKEACLQLVVFGIAWITMNDAEKEDIYTWFAADPTLY